MKKTLINSFCLLFLSIIAYFPASAQFNFKVDGYVKNDGKALAGAVVSLNNNDGKVRDTFSNATGNFSLILKPNEDYTIFISKAGYTKSEVVVSTIGFSEEDAEQAKGISKLTVELFEMPTDDAAQTKINDILSTPVLSYYYDFDKNALVSDQSLEESAKGDLSKVQKIVSEEKKKGNSNADTDIKYKAEIAEGDRLFKEKEYELASLSYSQASALKPSESYPKFKLTEIERLSSSAIDKERIAKEKELALAKQKELADAAAKAKAEAAERDRLAKEKALAEANAERDRIAKEKALANASEKERLAKEREMALAAERDKLAKEKAIADAAEKERLAKLKAVADAALAEKLAKDKALSAEAAEKARIAKEKADADAAEAARIAKEKAIADAALAEKLAKEKAIADAAEKERLAKEEEARALKKRYTLSINTGDSAYLAKNYTAAKAAYNKALTVKPAETYPKDKIAQIDSEIAKSGDYKNDLAKKYPEGITEEIVKDGKATDTRRIVVIGNKGVLYVKRQTSFGAIYYFKDGAAISEGEFIKNTETK